MDRPKDELPAPVIELKFKQALRRIREQREREQKEERGFIAPPTPPVPIRVMTDEEEEDSTR
ncbi:MAG: hypothetical protein ACYSW8_32860 [Planctomycetota bacterium]|jgi:hypothetical protein